MITEAEVDKIRIREVVENWVLFRDSGDWDAFRTVWHPDGWMTATWFQGPAEEFVDVSRAGFEAGANSSTTSSPATRGSGGSYAGSRSTRRTGWTQSTRRRPSSLRPLLLMRSRSATGIWLTSRTRRATT